ncbi:hypothetical protein Lfu02_03500 [Longispora fulva]|uniref:Uncharacterized protein n=1 Tax=Longispora fulva TaxID=619741 RepID=A0A8J7GRS0_9ACTN|nr:hypothetical protein [Longispora fulva]MBG6135781.1 hypothetical protein [Longispora fulva]GIG55978.1 hypothetical protein Lfu02_03500 [Longispora fulva]
MPEFDEYADDQQDLVINSVSGTEGEVAEGAPDTDGPTAQPRGLMDEGQS